MKMDKTIIQIMRADGGYIIEVKKNDAIVRRGVVAIQIDDIPKFKIAPMIGAYVLAETDFGSAGEYASVEIQDISF